MSKNVATFELLPFWHSFVILSCLVFKYEIAFAAVVLSLLLSPSSLSLSSPSPFCTFLK